VKAILMTATGRPDVLQLHAVPNPKPPTGSQLQVKLRAAGVNPIDTKLRTRGTFYPDQMPAVLGCDGAGVVTAVGDEATQFQVGDEVYFCNGGLGAHPGTYAEFATVDEQLVAPKPASLSFTEAAAAPLVLITAWEALFDRGRLEAGRRVLIHGGAGGVGHVAIQLAKLAGATVCTTVSSEAKAEVAKALGADYVIFYRETDVPQAVLDWTDGEGVELGFDTVGGAVLSQTFAATRLYGDVVTLLSPDSDADWKTARNRNLRVSFELMLTPMLQGHMAAQREQTQILRQCARLFDQGDLTVKLAQTLPLPQAAVAHRTLEAGSMLGKIVLEI